LYHFLLNVTQVGEVTVNVTYHSHHLAGSPLRFNVTSGDVDHEKSRIVGFGAWMAEMKRPNTFYVQLFDHFGHELVTTPTKASQQYQGKEGEEPVEDEEILQELHALVTVQAFDSRQRPLEDTFHSLIEYIGKSTWGIRYTVDMEQKDTIFLSVHYDGEEEPVGRERLPVFVQFPGAPFPPNSYQMIGPYPARQSLLAPDASALITNPVNARSHSLNKNGWLAIEPPLASMSDSDFRSQLTGSFHVEQKGVFLLLCLGVEHYSIDGTTHFSGDVWNVHDLQEGDHTLILSVFGKREWNFHSQCRFQPYAPLQSYPSESVVPDIIGETMMGTTHVLLQNLYTHPLDLQVKVLALNDTTIQPIVRIASGTVIAPQELSRVPLEIEFNTGGGYRFPKQSFVMILGFYSEKSGGRTQVKLTFPVHASTSGAPFRFTFVDTDGSVQSAMATRPRQACKEGACPVIVVSHGGGVNVPRLASFYPPNDRAWHLFPSGRMITPYELGPLFTTHTMAAVQGLASLVEDHPTLFSSYPVDENNLLSIGSHHHGGRGALLLANRYPDRMLGVSADSGWIKHNEPWSEDFIHPMLSGLMRWIASTEQDISLTTSNLNGVPLFGGAGKGDNVGFPWRLYYQQTLFHKHHIDAQSDSVMGVSYKKLPTAAVVPTKDALAFMKKRLASTKSLPREFTVSSWNPAVYHGRGGIHITALLAPTQLATIDVEIDDSLWILNTTNTRSFEIQEIATLPRAAQILIDGRDSFMIDTQEEVRFTIGSDGRWKEQLDTTNQRSMNQYGPVTHMYQEKVSIVCGTDAPAEVVQFYQSFAVFMANEIYKQHRQTVHIYSDKQYAAFPQNERTNVILLGGSQSNSVTADIMQRSPVPVSYKKGTVTVGECQAPTSKNAAALFLTPDEEHLAFVVSASSVGMMRSTIPLLPLHTPYDAFPDYVLIEESREWQGGNAILTAGMWDALWQEAASARFSQCPTFPRPSRTEESTQLW